ncbi:hypothetical protein I6F36_21165 [Bradyrhizobium sp. BRP19]|uniref:hypothetical protein n=1 Tax=Bradyrhizobium sp. BRP19 TaxID=2793823 RepID=UPI001CD32513|nr:hypothetical protein [Bradyrhizobium sp. BRP19]MCA1549344.1 hypothetical protein [Bradyrhizobium sp. BRP19]
MSDPWAFGWTQLLAIVGLGMSGIISFLGLRTFDKWQREKVHERKLEVAFEALTLAYESTMVFDDIRRRLVREYEWADMPTDGMSKEQIDRSRTSYALINRFGRHNDFFDRVLKLQPKIMAVFGPETEATMNKLHRARHLIQLACEMLIDIPDPKAGTEEWDLVLQARSDIWDHKSSGVKEPERVTTLLRAFRSEIEAKCGPFVNQDFQTHG